MFAGKNLSWWEYGVMVLVVIVGAYFTIEKVRGQIHQVDDDPKK